MAGYCTVKDVCSIFPFFQRNVESSIDDAAIQGWIDDRKAQIRSVFLTRGYDPDAPPNAITSDQSNFLRALNRDGAAADLGVALQGAVTLQPGEYSVAAARLQSFTRVLKEVTGAQHDAMFNSGPNGQIARHQDVGTLVRGIGGAEVSPEDTPPASGANRFFWKQQIF